MKQKTFRMSLLITMIIVIVSSITFSCSFSHEPMETTSSLLEKNIFFENNEMDNLMNALQEYSETYVRENATFNPRSGFSNFVKSVKADFWGHNDKTTHHEYVSISASRKKWKDIKKEENNLKYESTLIPSPKKREIVMTIDSLCKEYQNNNLNLGAIHNAVILSLIVNEEFYLDDDIEVCKLIINYTNRFKFTSDSTANAYLVNSDTDAFLTQVLDDNDEITCSNLVEKKSTNEYDIRIKKTFYDNFQQLSTSSQQREYTKGYISLIEKSNIQDSKKEYYIKTLSILPASKDLWEYVESLYN